MYFRILFLAVLWLVVGCNQEATTQSIQVDSKNTSFGLMTMSGASQPSVCAWIDCEITRTGMVCTDSGQNGGPGLGILCPKGSKCVYGGLYPYPPKPEEVFPGYPNVLVGDSKRFPIGYCIDDDATPTDDRCLNVGDSCPRTKTVKDQWIVVSRVCCAGSYCNLGDSPGVDKKGNPIPPSGKCEAIDGGNDCWLNEGHVGCTPIETTSSKKTCCKSPLICVPSEGGGMGVCKQPPEDPKPTIVTEPTEVPAEPTSAPSGGNTSSPNNVD